MTARQATRAEEPADVVGGAACALPARPTPEALQAALAAVLEREREHVTRCAAVEEATRDLAAAHTPDEVLQRLVDSGRGLVGARYGALAQVDERGQVRRYITSGVDGAQDVAVDRAGGHHPAVDGALGTLFQDAEPVLLRKAAPDGRAGGLPAGHPPVQTLLGVPITLHGRSLGYLYLAEKACGEEFSEDDERAVLRLVRYAAVAIENARLYEAAEAERRRLQTILDALPDGVILADSTRDGAIVMTNRAAARLWGGAPGRVENQNGPEFSRPEGVHFLAADGSALPMAHLPLSRALRGETALGVELIVVQPSGRRLPVVASGVPLRGAGGRLVGAVASFEDITQLKEAERVKREFLSLVTHELRTPLTGIKGIVSGLLADDVALDPAERRGLLALVDQAADHLAGLVTNLLDMSRLEAGALDLDSEACHVADVAAGAVQDTAGVLRAHVVQVDVPAGLPEVWVDYAQAKRVLANLLANAAKYTPEGTHITVLARMRESVLDCGEDMYGSVVVSVRDDGPGLAPGEVAHVFDRFYRGSGRPVRGQAGTGLGLAIARGLVEAMGGRIWVESEPGHGASFSFTLPTSAAAVARDDPREAAE